MTKPLAISMGDPCGIGPEIIFGAAKEWISQKRTTPLLVFGDCNAFDCFDIPFQIHYELNDINSLSSEILHIWQMPVQGEIIKGLNSSDHAEAVTSWIKEAFKFTINGITCALTTAPIAKSILQGDEVSFPGHTEFLESLSEPYAIKPTAVMMLATRELKVIPATIHIALNDVSNHLSVDKLVNLARITYFSLKNLWHLEQPKLVMAGLNPHAGENGLFGKEEITILVPAVKQLQSEGISITGPYSADSLFHSDARKNYDAAICMYHDQALIPLKTINFWEGVNITLGLPIIRTSPDHGTGFDIAGRGIARHDSMLWAMEMAVKLSQNKND